MAEDFLDDVLRKFIAEHIDSVEQLEILFLLSASPSEAWTVDGVFEVIKSNPISIGNRLQRLHQSGFLQLDREGRYRFAPPAGLVDLVTKLASAYHQSRVKVLEAIFTDSTDQARTFAASFRIRKD